MNRKKAKLQQMPLNATKDAPDVGWPAGHTTAKVAQPALGCLTTGAELFLEERGITAEFLVKECLKPALIAERTVFFFHQGSLVETREVPAWETRLRALQIALKLMGAYETDGKAEAVTKSDVIFLLKTSEDGQGRATSESNGARRNEKIVELSHGDDVAQPFEKRIGKWRTGR
jgi:hypothetical protein